MRKLKFIINPAAGKGAAKALIEPLHRRMEKSGLNYDVVISRSKGQIESLAVQAIMEGYNELIAVGGDGTLTEMIRGIYKMDPINIIAGTLPCGTGNDFSKVLYSTQDPLSILEIIIAGISKQVDVINCNGMPCINVCAMGIDGPILLDTEKIKRFIPGPAAYLVSTIKSLLRYKARKVEIIIDQHSIQRNTLLIAAGNGRYFGGGMKITPFAEIDDQLIDVCIVNNVSKVKLLSVFPSIFKGEHLKVKEVEYFKCSEISVNSLDQSLLLNVDGNIVGTTPAKITIARSKIYFYCK